MVILKACVSRLVFAMTSNRLDPVGTGSHPPAIESDSELEERGIDTLNPGLLTLNNTKTQTEATEYNAASESESGQQDFNEKPRHAGFWHHDLVNVRLHVIKLWLRTGEHIPSARPARSSLMFDAHHKY